MPRRLRFLLAFLLTLLLIVAGCDTVGTEHPPDEPLLQIEDASPGAVVYNLSTTGAVKEYFPGGVDDERGGLELPQSRAASQPASDYACYLSAYRADGERGPGYYYRSIYLHFPKPLVEEAEGKMGTLRYAWHDEAVDHPSKVAMLARCRLPQTRGAAELLAQRLGLTLDESRAESAARRAPPAEALRAGEGNTTEAATAGDELPVYYPVLDGDIPNGAGYTCTDGTDWMSYDMDYCTDGTGVFLPEMPVEDDPPPPGGGGSGGGGGSDDPTWPGDDDDGPLHDPAPLEDDGLGGTPPASAPDGVSQDVYDQLNVAEKFLCWDMPVYCIGVYQYTAWALNWSASTGLGGAHNGPQDAVRHAAWSGRVTMAYGAEIAKLWTDAHEWDSASADETAMDQHNNQVGRSIGLQTSTTTALANDVLQAYHDGDLCTSPDEC